MSDRKARIIAIANEKGGVGKTATAVNLSAALAKMGKKTLVVDTDPQHNATMGFGVYPKNGMITSYDLITNSKKTDAKAAVLTTNWPNLFLIPGHVDLTSADIDLVDKIARETRLQKALTPIADDYDFIIIDTPPTLSLLTVNVFVFAKEILVPCQTQPYAVRALDELFDTIEMVKEEINPELSVIGILATFYDKRTRISKDVMEELKAEKRFRHMVFKTAIRANSAIPESVKANTPIVYHKTRSYGALDYNKLAEELLGL